MKPRVLGGYLVVPTAETLGRFARGPVERAELARLAIGAMLDALGDMRDLRADVALELRRRNAKWDTVGRRLKMNPKVAFRIAAARRAALANPPAGDALTAKALDNVA